MLPLKTPASSITLPGSGGPVAGNESLENLESLKSLGKQRSIRQESREFRDCGDLRASSSEKTPFAMTTFFGS